MLFRSLDDMSTGIECLLADNPDHALYLAGQLDDMNQTRRHIEADMQRTALAALDAMGGMQDGQLATGICLYEPGWHQGVIGILASRVKDRLHRPVIAFADAGDGWLKGSARSIPGFHVRDALDAVATSEPGLLDRFGGHAMAAGLSLRVEDFPRFAAAFDREAARCLSPDELESVLLTDGELAPADISLATAELLHNSGPWGQHFPEPLFEGRFELVQQRLVGERHLKMVLRGGSELLDAIAFNVDLDRWPDTTRTEISLCYRLDVNSFRGQTSLQLVVEHLA